jgi:hypothetical protein
MTTPTTKRPAVRHPRQEPVTDYVRWGSRLTPEEREWQITKLLPAILATLDDIADDAVNADAAKDAAGKPIP